MSEVSAYIAAAVKRCKLPIGVTYRNANGPLPPAWITWRRADGWYFDMRDTHTPREAIHAYLALCRTLEGQ